MARKKIDRAQTLAALTTALPALRTIEEAVRPLVMDDGVQDALEEWGEHEDADRLGATLGIVFGIGETREDVEALIEALQDGRHKRWFG